MEQNRNLAISPHICEQITFDKGALKQQLSGEGIAFSTNGLGTIGYPYAKNNNFLSIPCIIDES